MEYKRKKSPIHWLLPLFFAQYAIFANCEQNSLNQPLDKTTIVVAIEGNPTSLDPRTSADAYSTQILSLVFPGLFYINQNFKPEPLIVDFYKQISPTIYYFSIKRDFYFSNGKPLTARDVEYTLKTIKDPALKSPYLETIKRIKNIEIVDSYSFRFELFEAYAPLLTALNIGIVSEPGNNNKSLYGAGPYKIVSVQPGDRIELVINPFYRQKKPSIKRITFRIIPDDVTRIMSLEKGEVHLIQNPIPPDDLSFLKQNPGLQISIQPGSSYSYMGFNLTDPILSNKLVRKSIAHSIPREEIINCLLGGFAIPSTGLFPPSHWAYEKDVENYPYNPELAKRLLDQAGYPDPDGDGPLPRFRLSYKTSQNKQRIWIAQSIAYYLKKVGIEVEIRSYEWGTLFADIQSGNFQIYTLSWVGLTDPDIYYTIFHSQSVPPNGANRGRYNNPQVDKLTELARISSDERTRKALYSQVQKIVADELPYISLWHQADIWVSDRKLKNFKLYHGGDWKGLQDAYWEEE